MLISIFLNMFKNQRTAPLALLSTVFKEMELENCKL